MTGPYAWDGGGSDGNWSTAANWVDDVLPPAGSALFFSNGVFVMCLSDRIARSALRWRRARVERRRRLIILLMFMSRIHLPEIKSTENEIALPNRKCPQEDSMLVLFFFFCTS